MSYYRQGYTWSKGNMELQSSYFDLINIPPVVFWHLKETEQCGWSMRMIHSTLCFSIFKINNNQLGCVFTTIVIRMKLASDTKMSNSRFLKISFVEFNWFFWLVDLIFFVLCDSHWDESISNMEFDLKPSNKKKDYIEFY